jgi:Spx/MgsR family transcriptional regulator
MSITVYGIPNCDSVKRARVWLDEAGLSYHFHDFKKAGVPPEALARWLAELGWERVINRAGTTWRKLDDASKAGVVDAASAAALAVAQPSVIKRPVVQWTDGSLSIGFSPEVFLARR